MLCTPIRNCHSTQNMQSWQKSKYIWSEMQYLLHRLFAKNCCHFKMLYNRWYWSHWKSLEICEIIKNALLLFAVTFSNTSALTHPYIVHIHEYTLPYCQQIWHYTANMSTSREHCYSSIRLRCPGTNDYGFMIIRQMQPLAVQKIIITASYTMNHTSINCS